MDLKIEYPHWIEELWQPYHFHRMFLWGWVLTRIKANTSLVLSHLMKRTQCILKYKQVSHKLKRRIFKSNSCYSFILRTHGCTVRCFRSGSPRLSPHVLGNAAGGRSWWPRTGRRAETTSSSRVRPRCLYSAEHRREEKRAALSDTINVI